MGKSHVYPHFRLKAGPFLRILTRRNISQNELARRCRISSAFMSQLLSGKRNAGPETRQKIVDAFGLVDFDQLFEEIDANE